MGDDDWWWLNDDDDNGEDDNDSDVLYIHCSEKYEFHVWQKPIVSQIPLIFCFIAVLDLSLTEIGYITPTELNHLTLYPPYLNTTKQQMTLNLSKRSYRP